MSIATKVLVLGRSGGIGRAVVNTIHDYYLLFPKNKWRYPGSVEFPDIATPDVIVNCAGTILPSSIVGGLEGPKMEMAVNYMLPLDLMRTYPDAVHINVGSSAATKPRAGWAGYCASKAALHSLVKSAADEGIRSFCISPGRTATPMREAIAGKEDPNTLLDPYEISILVRDILNGKYINGAILEIRKVDGEVDVTVT